MLDASVGWSCASGEEDRLLRKAASALLGEMRVVARAEYHVPVEKAELLARPVTMEFANHVAVMVLVPYLREALSDLSLRVFDQRIVMPMFKRGELWFDGEPQASPEDD